MSDNAAGEEASDLSGLRAQCPKLAADVDALAAAWLKPAIERLAEIEEGRETPLRAKHVNDPIWRTFVLEDREVLLLDSPLLQRTRGIKQLGLANTVFPGANHDRFEHICGVVEAADRMFDALKRNAERRRRRGREQGIEPPTLTEEDRAGVRLAALLHDVGHGPFSHAIEPVIAKQYETDLKNFNKFSKRLFAIDSDIDIAELISILIVSSPSMAIILKSNIFFRPSSLSIPEYQLQIACLIMGARRKNYPAFLSAIISSSVDADKLDYMPRDAHHAGMPIGFDTERLLHKLEIIRCTPESLPARQTVNREFAESCPAQHYEDIGIAASGLGSLEQMLIGRVFLYDRLYHHHKVRAADAMAQRLLHYAEKERGAPFTLEELYHPVGDDTMIRLIGGQVTRPGFKGGGETACELANDILDRNLYVRAFAFRATFHIGLPQTSNEQEKTDALAEAWSRVSTDLSDLQTRLTAEKHIVERARALAVDSGDRRLCELAEKISDHHVIVDLAKNRVKSVTINMRGEDGSLEEPDLFFNSARWSHVYDLQKRTGYVFCRREYLPLVALAAKVFFFEKWGYAASDKADRLTKTLGVIKPEWLDALHKKKLIDDVAKEVLARTATVRAFIRKEDIKFPDKWNNEDPDLSQNIADQLRCLLPQGVSAQDRQGVLDTLKGLASFIDAWHCHARWSTEAELNENKQLQARMVEHLRAMKLTVTEGAELSGGETDLIINNLTLIENKVVGEAADPLNIKREAAYQANRYAIALCQRIFFTVIAYKPENGAPPLRQTESITVRKLTGQSVTAVEIRAVVPYGCPVPSRQKKP